MKVFSTVIALLSVLCVGCSRQQADYSSVDLVDVSGTITLDGEPVENAVVLLEDVNTGLQSPGLTDSSGHYRLKFDSDKYGVIPGEKKVVVSTTMKVLGLNSDEEGGESSDEGEQQAKPVELIPEAYRSETRLRVTIDDSTKKLDFNLASDGSTTGPA